MIFSSYSSYVYYLVAIVFFSIVATIALLRDFKNSQREDGSYPSLFSSIFFVIFIFSFILSLGIFAYNYFFYIGEEYDEISTGRYEEVISLSCEYDKYNIKNDIKKYISSDKKLTNKEYYQILKLQDECKDNIQEKNSFFKKLNKKIDNYFIKKDDIKKEELKKSFSYTP